MEKYAINNADIAEAIFHAGLTPRLKFAAVGLVLGVGYAAFKYGPTERFVIQSIIFVVFIVIALPIYWKIHSAYKASVLTKKSAHFEGEFVTEFSESGFSVSNATTSSSYSWDQVRKWGQTQRLILIFVGSYVFHMIPKAAFDSDARGIVKERFPGASFPFPDKCT